MKYLHQKFIIIVLSSLVFVSCASQPTISSIPANTLDVIITPQPSPILTATPIFTPTQTPTPFVSILSGTPLPLVSSVISPDKASQVIQLARWGDGLIWRALVSPNGKFVVLISSIGFYLYNSETFEIVRFIETDSDIGGVAISPDSQILAIGTRERMLVYSLNDGTLITTINKSATNLAFSPDGQKIAIGAGDWDMCRKAGSLELWQVSDWSLLQTLPLTNELDCIGDLVFSPSGNFLAASAFEVLVWDISESSSKLKVESWGCDIFEGSLAFTTDEKTLVVGTQADSGRDEICLIRLADGEILGALDKANKSNFSCGSQVLISPDGQLMASNLDGKVMIWQTGFWKQIHSLDFEGNCAQLSGWLPDGKTLTFLLPDGNLQFLNTQTGKIIRSAYLRKPSTSINTVAWSPDGKTIAAGNGKNGNVTLWDVKNGNSFNTLSNESTINSLSFSPGGEKLAVGLENDQARIWGLSDGSLLQILDGVSGYGLTSVSFSPDNTLIALDIEDELFEQDTDDVQIWDTKNWEPVLAWTVAGDGIVITSVRFSPDGKTVTASSYRGILQIWNIETKAVNQTIIFPGSGNQLMMTVAYSPDSQYIASSTFDGQVGVWRASDGKLQYIYDGSSLKERKGNGEAFYDNLAWSPDGQTIALAASDGTIHLIDASDGTLLKRLEGHTMWATGVAFSPDGKMLVSCSNDGTIRLWGIAP
jgi:WD40 repeat protein